MLLKRLEICNVRKIKQASIDFHGPGLQVIQGANASGKSSLALSILMTMNGAKAMIPGMITQGQETAEILAYTDDGLKIRTVISDSVKQTVQRLDETTNRYVNVTGGVREFLNSICSGLEMPYSMKSMTDEKIIELLKKRCGITDKIQEIDNNITAKSQLRTDVGRDKKKLGTPTVVKEVKHPEPINEIQSERAKAKEFLEWVTDRFNILSQQLRNKCNFTSMDELVEYRDSVDQSRNNLIYVLAEKEKSVGKKYTQEDLYALEKSFTEWVAKEQAAKDYDEYDKKVKEIEKLDTQYNDLTKEIEELREKRKKTLSEMNLGVKGLEIGEDNMLYHNGVLRGITETNKDGNWSTAESVQVFFTLGVRFSGDLKILVVDNGESLDEDVTSAITKWAEKFSYLVILLKVAKLPDALEEQIIYVKEGEVIKK